ncbi:hypothetical protein E2C01_071037 [Portunus trituberculatus]|uniref:Uncharacterized protein n=1 Tax=Portunus trituberculatus TaxID=210409 RepID=A0A5B7HVW3_PORTR|nr:hypothetical protein [Portunus trituberculatus]
MQLKGEVKRGVVWRGMMRRCGGGRWRCGGFNRSSHVGGNGGGIGVGSGDVEASSGPECNEELRCLDSNVYYTLMKGSVLFLTR